MDAIEHNSGEIPTMFRNHSDAIESARHAAISRLLLGPSTTMQHLRALIARLAPTRAAVLIQGPTGAGKELVAEATHICSGRAGAFVPFNVCAIGEGMFEAAIFGHARGAFTGAVQDTAGYLAEANGGTAFFDEISGLSLAAQAKLLRAIETRSFRPVGARRDRSSDFRIIAASNDDLDALASAGQFRADLLHRLRALVIRVPALVEHLEDLPFLARHFASNGGTAPSCPVLTDEAIERLMRHAWPGNVRELRNIVEFAVVLADGPVIGAPEVSAALGAGTQNTPHAASLQRQHWLLSILQECDWNTARAASQLGLHRSNVYRMMQRLGISAPRRRHNAQHHDLHSQEPARLPDRFALFAMAGANSRPIRANADAGDRTQMT